MVRFNLIVCLTLAVVCGTVGCPGSSDYKPVGAVKKASPLETHGHDHDHGHAEKGPHGGGLIELGEEEYHAEIVVDHDAHAVSLFVLGKDAKTAEPIAAPEVKITPEGKTELVLKAVPQPGEPEGKASKFELVSDDVVHDLLHAGFLHGELRITIADKPYIGHIDYHMDGGDHDHDHEEKK
jgi:hypothetical protein